MDRNLLIHASDTVKTALRRLDDNGRQILFVVDDDLKLLGTLTDGDIRRIILKNTDLSRSLSGLFHSNPTVVQEESVDREACRSILLRKKIRELPVVNAAGQLVDCLTWDQVFSADESQSLRRKRPPLHVPVIIMAGGKGTRLEPFTMVLPKPLVPVGDRTIMERIISGFTDYGINQVYVTLNYRGEMIRSYFDGIKKEYRLHYVWEKEFLGTAGSLRLLPATLSKTFFVSNCDIIVKADYAAVLAFHRKQRAALTVISSYQHHVVPYGVVDFRQGGQVVGIREKPEYTFPINTGVYVMEKRVCRFIAPNQPFDMPHLIEALLAHGEKVVTYPVNEKDYTDIGHWAEYRKAIQQML